MMRFLLGLILTPVAAVAVTAALLVVSALLNPHAMALFWDTSFWFEGIAMALACLCAYAAPTAIVLLPLVDRARPLNLWTGAALGAVGGAATVLLSIPLKPSYVGLDLMGKSLIVALMLATIGGTGTGLAFVIACRRFVGVRRR